MAPGIPRGLFVASNSDQTTERRCDRHRYGRHCSSSVFSSVVGPTETCSVTKVRITFTVAQISQPNRSGPVKNDQLRSLTGGSNEKVLARKRGACGDARRACNGGGHAGQGQGTSGGLLRLERPVCRLQRRRHV